MIALTMEILLITYNYRLLHIKVEVDQPWMSRTMFDPSAVSRYLG